MPFPLFARLLRPLHAGLLVLAAAPALALQVPPLRAVEVPAEDGAVLRAHWFPAAPGGARPAAAVVALHGCGGLYAKGGGLGRRYRETAERLHRAGYAVLMPDSFGSRGLADVCQTRYGARGLTVAARAGDARAALAWLARQPEVDARRVALLGWSNGATTILNVLAQRADARRRGEPLPPLAGAAVFYPGCGTLQRAGTPLDTVPLLLQIGALDDWTPAAPCVALMDAARARAGSDVTLHVYPGSYHGFDGTTPLRVRGDVPASNGTGAVAGVHQGGNPQARGPAITALDGFLARVLAPAGASPAAVATPSPYPAPAAAPASTP